MRAFTSVSGIAVPLLTDNVDTDTIIPSREMKSTGRSGLEDGLFANWRYSEGRTLNPGFVLNDPRFAHQPILAGGGNFGCGSSREHAVWALAGYGVRAIVAPSFAPIFAANCIRNGLLPVVLDREAVEALAGREVTIDLAAQTVTAGAESWSFAIEPEPKAMLLQGLDAIGLTLESDAQIEAWLTEDRKARPWVYLEKAA